MKPPTSIGYTSLYEFFSTNQALWGIVSVARAITEIYTNKKQRVIADKIRKHINIRSLWEWNYAKATTREQAIQVFKELNV